MEPWMVEELEKAERAREEAARPYLRLPLPEPEMLERTEPAPSNRGVTIIDL